MVEFAGPGDFDRLGQRPRLNPFLSRVCIELRRSRPPIDATITATFSAETVAGRPFVRIWFRTSGCRRDAQGSCTMCDYGVGGETDAEAMISSVSQLLHRHPIPTGASILVSPSGSMFDDREVPREARDAILRLVAGAHPDSIACETRVETVSHDSITSFISSIGDAQGVVEVGLESADPWVLRNCVNKQLDLRDYQSGIGALAEQGVRSATNVSLGTAFLNESEAISDAVRTAEYAHVAGSDLVVLFPLHVRKHTLLHWLWSHGLYQPVSLWALVEVLHKMGPTLAARSTISWYRDRAAPGEPPVDGIVASPGTCPRCVEDVLAQLDDYRDSGEFGTVERLAAHPCACRWRWKRRGEADKTSLPDRVAAAYAAVGIGVLGASWWRSHSDLVLESLAVTELDENAL